MIWLRKRALFGYLPIMTAGNDMVSMLVPEKVQDTGHPKPFIE